MSLLNRKVDYGLLILCDLQQRPEGGSAREVAGRLGLSRPFAANILKRLCGAGLVRSHRGIRGGYALTRPAPEVCLAEVMEALGTPFHLVPCCQPQQDCDLTASCPMRQALAEVDRRIRQLLGSVTLADLVGYGPPGTCCAGAATEFGLELAARIGAVSS
jgi:Rrf2 family protein